MLSYKFKDINNLILFIGEMTVDHENEMYNCELTKKVKH